MSHASQTTDFFQTECALKQSMEPKKSKMVSGYTFGGQPGFFGDPDHLFPPQKIFSWSDLQPKMAFPRNTLPDCISWCLFHQPSTGSTIRTLLHGKINPKDWQVLSLGDVRFLICFRVVSGDYGKPWSISWKHITCVWTKIILTDIRCQNKKTRVPPESSWRQMPQEINEPASPTLGFWLLGVFIVQLLGNGRWLSSRGSEVCQCACSCQVWKRMKCRRCMSMCLLQDGQDGITHYSSKVRRCSSFVVYQVSDLRDATVLGDARGDFGHCLSCSCVF